MGGADNMTSLVKGPKEAYLVLAEKGRLMVRESSLKFFGQCVMAGCYIGFGAHLAVVISGAMPGITDENPGLKKLIFAYLFPVNLVLITLTGGVLYTGTAVATPAAFFERKASLLDVLRCLVLSWVGNLLGSLVFAGFILWCDLLDDRSQASFLSIAEKKTSARFDVTFARGIGCNWMVSMAVLLSGQAQDMFGKVVAIYLPISTFVMLGFEHTPANFYLLGMTVEAGDMSFLDVLLKNLLPTTLGNLVAGAVVVAGSYSYFFGNLGNTTTSEATEPFRRLQAQRSMGIESDVEDPENQPGTDDPKRYTSRQSASSTCAPSISSRVSFVPEGEEGPDWDAIPVGKVTKVNPV
ncbi:fdhC [Symbiodinium necroappetens]|uniref:FdhC protein n=1 Tax=Symbiodinium necroappetens TaxID=1628268 RepID=A0A812S6G9_9DINO|nr:fdhC [Symbiodinium necroappetens]|mmetsp:Transcript_132078/g.313047  ORF Transcript_132078/g.313047 Transcript_132078/m.313047 type:complete len:352 (+) Transcript_132078:85-1140(+)